ncbi:ABC transporter ATP-binding protein [Oecophyllibacter saccharovorans]|uniref:ABC transporter ATP-binding protein n=2 Tax=Oecophyllibacter saccharovorans TaxID=2558360 RepID=A0A506ULR8_9PROT|nr:ABC transporter ATP-binding protein [Oecophyllibacter saccharovorans]
MTSRSSPDTPSVATPPGEAGTRAPDADFSGEKPLPSFMEVLQFVFRRWAAHPWLLAQSLGGVGVATIADIVTPLAAGRLIADIAAPVSSGSGGAGAAAGAAHLSALHDALLMVGALLGLGVIGVVGRRSSYLGLSHLNLAIMRQVLDAAFARVQRFSSDWHANTFAGSTVRRLTRGLWAIDSLDDTLLLLILPEIIVLLGTTLVLMAHSLLMGCVLAGSVAIFAFTSIRLALNYVAPASRRANQWDTRMGAALADSITCNAAVKSFGAEKREEARLNRITSQWSRRTLRSWIRGTNSANLQASLSLIMRVLLIGLAVWMWWQGKMGPGDVAYVLTMMFLIQGYLRDLGQQVSQVQRAVNEMEELVGLFVQEPAVQDRRHAGALQVKRGKIKFEDVDFRYPAQKTPIYRNLSLDITPGTRLALVGPSGSGKTTLTRLLQRLYDIQGGRITIDGQDIAAVSQASLRANIALVPQEPVLFHRSLAENIAYGRPDASMEEIREAARLAHASAFIERLPEGYDTLVGERGVKLSGGERQRVAIARAFLSRAPIVIFDEATASLDSESEVLVQEALARLMEGRTVIVVAHRLSTVRDLDRILVFEHGRIVEDGNHAELMKRDGIYRRLVALQTLEKADRPERVAVDAPQAGSQEAQSDAPE